MRSKSPKPPAYIAAHIRTVLKTGGSAPHSEDVQRFFKHEVKARGWRTAELRKVAKRFLRTILAEHGQPYLLLVADQLFAGEVLEEKNFAVMLLEGMTQSFGRAEFTLFETWLDRVTSWADHDGLVHYLIGPMVAADASYLVRQHKNFSEIQGITELLLASKDDMVQKGLGWLLREAAKANREQAVAYLMEVRERLPRFVLRTACETLPVAERLRVLEKAKTLTADSRGLKRIKKNK